jgi:hypothetical protein
VDFISPRAKPAADLRYNDSERVSFGHGAATQRVGFDDCIRKTPRRPCALSRACPSRDLGIALSVDLGERLGAIYHASPSEGGRGDEAGAPAAYVDNACALDSEAGFLESGIELCRRELRRRLL